MSARRNSLELWLGFGVLLFFTRWLNALRTTAVVVVAIIISGHLWANSAHSLHFISCDIEPVCVSVDWSASEANVCRSVFLRSAILFFCFQSKTTSSLLLLLFFHLFDSPVVVVRRFFFLIATIRLCSWLEHVFTYLEIFIDVIQLLVRSSARNTRYNYTIAMWCVKCSNEICYSLPFTKKNRNTH